MFFSRTEFRWLEVAAQKLNLPPCQRQIADAAVYWKLTSGLSFARCREHFFGNSRGTAFVSVMPVIEMTDAEHSFPSGSAAYIEGRSYGKQAPFAAAADRG
jgi:hypothetical protein